VEARGVDDIRTRPKARPEDKEEEERESKIKLPV
jgi:hypothetical protein